jgi:hypothetical protein
MITDQQLDGFRLMHAGFRTEFGRLATAARQIRDHQHEQALTEQLTLVLELLHAHHTHEDDVLWPRLLRGEPSAAAALAELETEHERLQPLLERAADASVPLAERAETLFGVHQVIGEHLDHEEQIAFPLMIAVLTPAHIADDNRAAMADIGRRRMPVVFGWLASCAEPSLLARQYEQQPLLVRVLFRAFWWPSYRRRFARLYGDELAMTLPLSVPAPLAA